MNTFTLPKEMYETLEQYAKERNSSVDALATQAVEEFIAREEAELDEIRASIAAADRGEFATEEEVKAVFRQFNPHPRFR